MGGGIGSNFDFTDYVNALVKKESKQIDRLRETEKNQKVKLSTYGQLTNYIQTLGQSIDAVKSAFQTVSYTASVQNSSVINAQIISNNNVYAATHQIVVSQLAQVETLASVNQFSARDSALSINETLNFTIGSNSFSISILTTDTLDSIRDKVNSSLNNIGITASVMASTNGLGQDQYSLIFSSNNTGLANKLSISGDVSNIFDFSNEISAAQNAVFTVDGNNVIRSTNKINDVMDGVSFTLLANGSSALTITENNGDFNTNVTNAIQNMINAYNQAISFIDQSYASRTLPHSSVIEIKNYLTDLFNSELTNVGSISSLADIGITMVAATPLPIPGSSISYYSTGQLQVDTTKLNDFISNNTSQLESFFLNATNGFVTKGDTIVSNITQGIGVIPSKTQMINEEISRIDKKIFREEDRLEKVRKRLKQKYDNLSTMMAMSDHMSEMLTQQLANLNGSGGKK